MDAWYVKGTPDCIPCLLRQTLNTARQVTDDPWLHRKVLNEVMGHLQKADFDRTPAELVTDVARLAGKALGSQDAWKGVKAAHRLEAQALEGALRKQVAEAEDPLVEAVRLSVAANAVDAAALEGAVSLAAAVEALNGRKPAIDDSGHLRADVEAAAHVLFVLDNAGELLLDRLVIEQLVALGKEVTCVVQRCPVLNEATADDAALAELERICRVIDPGTGSSGVPLALASADARERFDGADLVIAKGSASYETLEGEPKRKYFLIRVKCTVVARHLGVQPGDLVILRD